MATTRKLIVQQWVTVDNIAAEEDGGLSYVTAEPFDDAAPTPYQNSMMAFMDSLDTMILGANTYRQSKDYWPYAEDQGEWGRKLNELTKYVVSTTLDEAPWGDFPPATVTADPVATIKELKQQDGKDLWMWGSLQLMHSMIDAGVVDEVRLLVCPASRGKGTRVFEDSRDLKLIDATGYDGGIVIMRYEIVA